MALGLVALVLWLPDRIAEARFPEPIAAWVAIEEEGSGLARVGRVELAAGTPFRLHAVLEARDHQGATVYFTEAMGLELGNRRVPEAELRRWPEGRHARVLWFTVEGLVPFLPLADEEEDLGRFELQDLLRPDWPRAWSIPGSLEPRRDEHLRRGLERVAPEIGTQRFHVRIELLDTDDALVPRERIRSWAAADLSERLEAFPTAVVTLPEPLTEVSRVFGLTQIEPVAAPAPAIEEEIAVLERQELAFRRSTLLERHLDASGRRWDELAWRRFLPGGSGAPEWETEARPGDLVRLGDRVVVLYRPAGEPGPLGLDDLAFDFERGALRGPLSAFFAPGPLEWAPVAGAPP